MRFTGPFTAFALALLLGGCKKLDERLDDVNDNVQGYTTTRVIEAIYLGADQLEVGGVDLSDTELGVGSAIKVFLADASEVSEIENTPVEGATVRITSQSMGSLELEEEGGGVYELDGDGGLLYTPGENFALSVTYDGETSKVSQMKAPQPIDLEVDSQHSPNTALVLDVSGYDYDTVLVAVLDAMTGEMTYTNYPEDVQAVYDMTHSDEPVRKVEVPARAFSNPQGSLYALGVAGMKTATQDNYEDFNVGLSAVMAGELVLYPIYTY